MRDIFVLSLYLPLLIWGFKDPFIAVLVYYFFSIADIHGLGWGFASTLPWAYISVSVILISWLISNEKPKFVFNTTNTLFVFWGLWFQLTSLLAINFSQGESAWERFTKIWVIALFCSSLFNSRQRITAMIGVLAGSIGFYGVKGGIPALVGASQLHGPSSFMDNNDFGFACVMMLPLLWFLRGQVPKPWQRNAMTVVCGLTLVSALASFSRGAFLALIAVSIVLWLQASRKFLLAVSAAGIALVIYFLMSPAFFARMETIRNYQGDQSAEERLTAWEHAIHVASARPLVGGGVGTFRPKVYEIYTPYFIKPVEAHSIYFQVLGDEGFVGLGLFLLILLVSIRNTRWLRRRTRDQPDLQWAGNLGFYCQLSLVGYAAGGAFLSQAYAELYYALAITIGMTRYVVEKSPETASEALSPGSGSLAPGRRPSILPTPGTL